MKGHYTRPHLTSYNSNLAYQPPCTQRTAEYQECVRIEWWKKYTVISWYKCGTEPKCSSGSSSNLVLFSRHGPSIEELLIFRRKDKGEKNIVGGSGTSLISSRTSITSGKGTKVMGRTRTKSKIQRLIPPKPFTTQSSSTYPLTAPSIPALISKAQSIIEHCDYDLANEFLQRILQRSPKNAEAREMLGVVQLETGLVQEARKVGLSHLILYFVNWWYVLRTSRPSNP